MTKKCNHCGYPVIDSMTTCPNCNSVVDTDKSDTVICPRCGAEVDADNDYCPDCGQPLYDDVDQATDDTSAAAAPEVIPVCELRPLALAGERRPASRTYEDEGDGVELARDNTMPGEASIDADLQAHLFFSDGQWFIEEGRDDCRSTFVHAGKGIKLAPGDIIRLGDREFEFNIKTK